MTADIIIISCVVAFLLGLFNEVAQGHIHGITEGSVNEVESQ